MVLREVGDFWEALWAILDNLNMLPIQRLSYTTRIILDTRTDHCRIRWIFRETSAVWGNLQGSDFTVLEDTYKFTALQCSPNILVLKVNLLLPLFFLSEIQI